jgi:Fic family protein
MDIKVFISMLKDKHIDDYQKMKYKYKEDFSSFLQVLQELYYKELPLLDFDGNPLVFTENRVEIRQEVAKLMLQSRDNYYGIKAAEDEIMATSAIESIDFSRDSVRNILKGMAPKDEQETRILGIKKGLEFIADVQNKINEENLYKLYCMTVGDFLAKEDQLAHEHFYRHDTVYIVSHRVEHAGLDHKKVPAFMKNLIAFIGAEDDINDFVKAAIIHFYIAYVHPYFDGNGRMARLVHLWFLVQKGYQSALFIPFSSQIEKSRKAYYGAFTTVEENKKISGKIDVTPFVLYFVEQVYHHMHQNVAPIETLAVYENAVKKGEVTKKETSLWQFVLSCYGTNEFSTKQLEKDFTDVAYATVRTFVLKFEQLGLLTAVKYGTRVNYKFMD